MIDFRKNNVSKEERAITEEPRKFTLNKGVKKDQ